MKKSILFAHSGGSQGGPGEGSYDLVMWLRKELPGFEISFPVIEDPEAPTYQMWKSVLDKEFSKDNKPSILIGHSLGSSMLLKYLSEEKTTLKISGLFLIATPQWGTETWAKDYRVKKDFHKSLPDIPELYLYHSRNDSVVPFSQVQFYRERLKNALVRELTDKDHTFSKGLPELIADLKSIISD